MNTHNTTTVNVAPSAPVVHINELLPLLHKPDEQVGGSVGFTPLVANVAGSNGAAILTGASSVSDSASEPVRVDPDAGAGSTGAPNVNVSLVANSNLAILNRLLSAHMGASGHGSEHGRNSGGSGSSSSSGGSSIPATKSVPTIANVRAIIICIGICNISSRRLPEVRLLPLFAGIEMMARARPAAAAVAVAVATAVAMLRQFRTRSEMPSRRTFRRRR
uniref:Uncharacterized protein n=1 Tax=Anopheles coluzzii TaxID=1518534 RepID=A0A8W7PKW5_ANOCL